MADSIVLRISGDSQELVRAVTSAKQSLSSFNVAVRQANQSGQGLAGVNTSILRIGESLNAVGTRLTAALTVPIVAAGASSFKAAADFESAFANVRKTLDTTGLSIQQETALLDQMRGSIRQMAKEIPQSTEELSKIASLGAQLGVSNKGLIGFTRTVADLGVAIDGITVEQAATQLAQLRNITKDSEENFSRMASTLVDLGNKSAATEGNILDFTLRLAGAGKEIGLQTHEIFALGTALASVGLNAEAGGTAMSRTIAQMQSAVEQGGESLTAFAEIARMSTDEFAQTFRDKPIAAIEAFLRGLKETKESGGALSIVLKDIGAEGVRQIDTLRRSSSAADLFNKALNDGKTAWEQNTAASEEARKKYETTYNQITVFWNRIKDIGITIGGPLIKAANNAARSLTPVVDTLAGMAEGFAKLPGPLQATVFGIGGITALAGPLALTVGQMVLAGKAITDLSTAAKGLAAAQAAASGVTAIGTASTGATGAVVGLRLALLSLGGVAVIAAIGAAAVAIQRTRTAMLEEAEARGQRIRDLSDMAEHERLFGKAAKDANEARQAIARYMNDVADAAYAEADAKRKSRLEELAKGGPGDPDAVIARIELARATRDQSKSTIDLAEATRRFNAPAGQMERTIVRLGEVLTPLQKAQRQYTDDLAKKGIKAFEDAAAMHKQYGAEVEKAASHHGIAASSLEYYLKKTAEAAKPSGPVGQLKKQIKDLDAELASANSRLSDKEISDAYGDQVQKITLAAKALGVAVTENVERAHAATERWAASEAHGQIKDELQAIADTINKLQEAQDEGQIAADKQAHRTIVEAQRAAARERESIWRSSLANQMAQIVQWGDDLKRENFDVVSDYEEFAASIDRVVGDRLQSLILKSEEWRDAVRDIPTFYGGLLTMALPPLDKTKDKTDEAKNKTIEWHEALQGLSQSLANLSEIGGDTFSGIAKTLATVVGAAATVKSSLDSISSGMSTATKPGGGVAGMIGGIASMTTGFIGLASAAITVGKALYDAFVTPRWETTMKRVGKEFGSAITKGIAEQIEADAEQLFGGDRQAAKLWNFGDIIKEGGLTSENFDLMMARLRDIFVMVDTGKFSVDQARKTLDDVFPEFAKHIAESGEFYSEKFREIIRLNNEMGIKSKEVAEFVASTTRDQGKNLTTVAAPLVKQADSLIAKMKELSASGDKIRFDAPGGKKPNEQGRGGVFGDTDLLSGPQKAELDKLNAEWDRNRDKLIALKPEIEAVGVLIARTFSDAQASGMGYTDSLRAVADAANSIKPAWDALAAAGVGINNSLLDQIINEAALVEKHKELVDAVAAGNEILRVGSALGKVTQDQFNAVATLQAANAERLAAAGFSQESIIRQMLPFLQQAVKLNKEQGVAIDETTQKYIDQAKEAGLSLEAQKTEAELLTDGFKNTNLALVALIKALGGEVPAALQAIADEANNAASKVEGITDNVGDMKDELLNAEGVGRRAMEEIARKARDAQEAIDGVSFGSSPGGLKEIPILVTQSKLKFADFADDMIQRIGVMRTKIDDADNWRMSPPQIEAAKLEDARAKARGFLPGEDSRVMFDKIDEMVKSGQIQTAGGSMKAPIELHIQKGAFTAEVVARTLGSERDLMKEFIAPEMLETIKDGGDVYGELASIVSGLIDRRERDEQAKPRSAL